MKFRNLACSECTWMVTYDSLSTANREQAVELATHHLALHNGDEYVL